MVLRKSLYLVIGALSCANNALSAANESVGTPCKQLLHVTNTKLQKINEELEHVLHADDATDEERKHEMIAQIKLKRWI